MFNTNIKTAEDLKEAAKRLRAAQIEEERKPRIFNVKSRVIGLDVEALKKQIEEKKAAREAEKAEDDAYHAQQKFEVKRMFEIERKIEQEKRRYMAEMLEFRKHHQTQEMRREFDLNDPHNKRKDVPCRLGDDDPRLTVSSIQKFEGEANIANQRKAAQKEQLKAWLAQQIKEKREAQAAVKAAEEHLYKSAVATDSRVKELEEMSNNCRREMEKAVREYNIIMAEEKKAAMKLEEQKEKEDVVMHITNMMNSELMTGTSRGQPSQLALDKVVKTSYRGLSDFEKARLKEDQLKQIEEKKAKERVEAQAEADWLNLEQVQAEKYVLSTTKSAEEKRRKMEDVREENRLLAIKQKAQRQYLEQYIYKVPGPDNSFYDQFNKYTR